MKYLQFFLIIFIFLNISVHLLHATAIGRDRLGAVSGFVYTYGTGDPVAGALLSLVAHPVAAGLIVTDETGFYEISGIQAGIYDLFVYARPFLTDGITDLRIADYTSLSVDFELLWAEIEIDPEFMMINLIPNEPFYIAMIITNDGCGELEYSMSYCFTPPAEFIYKEEIKDLQPGRYAPDLGRAPLTKRLSRSYSDRPVRTFRENNFYGVEEYHTMFCYFDEGAPEVLNNLGPASSQFFSNAGTFDPDDNDRVYELNEANDFGYYDTSSGEYTALGSICPQEGETWTGICVDPTSGNWFGVASDLIYSSLYLIDPVGMDATLIGATGLPALIDICIDGDGNCWSYDIINDVFVWLDKEIGTGIVIGPLGFDANFGQGMTWDRANDIIWLAAFNQSIMQGELRTVDIFTGNTMFWGYLGWSEPGAPCQLGWVSSSSLVTVDDFVISFDPPAGVVPPFGGQDVILITITVSDIFAGQSISGEIHIEHNAIDPYGEDVIIPIFIEIWAESERFCPFTSSPESYNYPNPFNPATAIRYHNPEVSNVTLIIYNLKGQKIKTLVDQVLSAGEYSTGWDGRDEKGCHVSSGIYLYRLKTGNYAQVRKMILLR
ncbi:MAG: T9SS type A sorting domain-containing protein [Candidatus Cloacimonetes bacterium]|nr:T9SS type A sorting domain-containing protein [Candidatus Cloacimonadota bacterium]